MICERYGCPKRPQKLLHSSPTMLHKSDETFPRYFFVLFSIHSIWTDRYNSSILFMHGQAASEQLRLGPLSLYSYSNLLPWYDWKGRFPPIKASCTAHMPWYISRENANTIHLTLGLVEAWSLTLLWHPKSRSLVSPDEGGVYFKGGASCETRRWFLRVWYHTDSSYLYH